MSKKEKKLTIKHFENKRLKDPDWIVIPGQVEVLPAVYIKVTFNRKHTDIKSLTFAAFLEETEWLVGLSILANDVEVKPEKVLSIIKENDCRILTLFKQFVESEKKVFDVSYIKEYNLSLSHLITLPSGWKVSSLGSLNHVLKFELTNVLEEFLNNNEKPISADLLRKASGRKEDEMPLQTSDRINLVNEISSDLFDRFIKENAQIVIVNFIIDYFIYYKFKNLLFFEIYFDFSDTGFYDFCEITLSSGLPQIIQDHETINGDEVDLFNILKAQTSLKVEDIRNFLQSLIGKK